MATSYIVDSLAIFEADERTDVEYHQYRDILSFQIGEAVSGKSYTASRSGLDNCPQMQAMLKIENLPFDFASEHQFDDSWLWSLTFDEMNGVSQTDFCGYIETIIQSVINNSIKNASKRIVTSVNIWRQHCWISLSVGLKRIFIDMSLVAKAGC